RPKQTHLHHHRRDRAGLHRGDDGLWLFGLREGRIMKKQNNNHYLRTLKLALALLTAWTATLVLGSARGVKTVTAQKKDSCIECHSNFDGPLAEPVKLMKDDIHKSR